MAEVYRPLTKLEAQTLRMMAGRLQQIRTQATQAEGELVELTKLALDAAPEGATVDLEKGVIFAPEQDKPQDQE